MLAWLKLTHVLIFRQLDRTWLALDWNLGSYNWSTAAPAVATFLLVALFDCSGLFFVTFLSSLRSECHFDRTSFRCLNIFKTQRLFFEGA